MDKDIQTVFFDVGNTLRIVLPDKPFIEAAEAELMRLTETKESHDEFFAKLESRWNEKIALAILEWNARLQQAEIQDN